MTNNDKVARNTEAGILKSLLQSKSASASQDPVVSREALAVNYRLIEELKPYPNNARTHNRRQIRKIADSIERLGFTNPVLIDANDTLIAGHGRVEAAKLLKMDRVPTITLERLIPSQVRAYILADNRLAEDAGWDKQILKIELQHLVFENEVDISVVGFEVAELDLIFGDVAGPIDPEAELPSEQAVAVTISGDLWRLGEHRIYCGDARDETSFEALMERRVAQAVFIDPPYNVIIDGHASGNGKIHHEEFAMASGELSEKEFTEFLAVCLGRLANWSANGSVHFIAMDWRHMSELLTA